VGQGKGLAPAILEKWDKGPVPASRIYFPGKFDN